VKRVKHFSLILLTGISALLLMLSLASLFLLNSGLLDLWAKKRLIALFDKKFYGRLQVDELHLKFPNNVILVNPRIYGPGEKTPSLQARSVSMRFNFLTVLQPDIKRLYLRRLDGNAFTATIIRKENGRFNMEDIFKSRDPDTTKLPLEHFFCNRLKLSGSAVTFRDNSIHDGRNTFYSNDADLELSSFTARKNFLKGTLDKLRFTLPQRNFSLQEASGKFLFTDTRSEVLALKAVSGKSRAELSATIDHFNIYSPHPLRQRLYKSSSFLNLQELSLHSDDIRAFHPAFAMPAGIYTFKGNARGKADNLEILDALLSHQKSRIALSGKLLNLQNPKVLAYQLECDSSRIASQDLEALLKEDSQKEVARRTGDIRFTGKAKGGVNSLQTELSLLSDAGTAELNAGITGEISSQLSASGSFAVKGLQPLKLMGDGKGKSLVNAAGTFQGELKGKEPGMIRLAAKLGDSFWQNQQVKEGDISIAYENRMLDISLSLADNASSATLDGRIDWKEPLPRYHASGRMARLDISKTLVSERYKTDLSGTWTLQGSGFDPAQLNISGSMQFSPSTINGYPLRDRSTITAGITQTAQSSRITITSDFLDFQAEGDYSFRELLDLGALASGGIVRELSAQDIWPLSLRAPTGSGQPLRRPFSATYHITVKDISPLALFLPVEGMTLQGKADGHASYRNGECQAALSFSLARVQTDTSFIVNNFAGDAAIECSQIGVRKAAINGKASSALLGGKKAGPSALSLIYSPSRLDASADISFPNPVQNLALKCTATRNGGSYDLVFSTLSLKDPGGSWQAPAGSRITLLRQSARFNRFTIAKGGQQVILDGELSNQLPGSFLCTLSGIELNELKRIYLDPSLDRLSGTLNASISVSGPPGAKNSVFRVSGQNMRYDKIMIGTLQANAQHNANLFRFDMHSNAAAGQSGVTMNTIEGSGTIPLSLSYYPFSLRLPERQAIRASFRSDNLSAQFLEYLLPLFESAEGIIPTTLRIEGTTPKPDIYLTSTLRNTKITIAPTQVSYLLQGEVFVTPQAMELRNISMADSLQGRGTISGMVKLDRLEPKEITLGGKFTNLLLFDKKDKKDETSFGSITASSNNILMHGTLSSPVIEGELTVNRANFSLYRFGANESAKYIGVEKFIEFVPRHPSQAPVSLEKTDVQPDFYYSLIDLLDIRNLRLSSSEPLKCAFIFDRIRGEQLETSLGNLSLTVNKNNQQYDLFGTVNVTGGKYRFSNSSFDLQDGGRIVWNNVDIRSGVMDNIYGGKSVNALNLPTGDRDNVKLLVAVTGTLNEPKVVMGYYLNEQSQPYASQSKIGSITSQIDPNADLNFIAMMFSKQWYIRPGGSAQSANTAVSNVGISAGTGLLSSRISKAIENIAGLESFNVNMGVDKRGEISGLDLYFALKVPGTGGRMRFIGTGTSLGSKQSVTTDNYGMSQKIEYRVTPKVYVEASRSYGQLTNSISNSSLQKPSETWGVSVSYKERFHSWGEFWKHLFHSSDKNK
jgi:hypothetical protein